MQNLSRPKFSAMVCPMSASVDRAPKFTPAPRAGEYARIGTYSREWSVGLPARIRIAAVIRGNHQQIVFARAARRKSPSSASNSSRDLANPSTSLRWPYSMSKSTRLQKNQPVSAFASRRRNSFHSICIRFCRDVLLHAATVVNIVKSCRCQNTGTVFSFNTSINIGFGGSTA